MDYKVSRHLWAQSSNQVSNSTFTLSLLCLKRHPVSKKHRTPNEPCMKFTFLAVQQGRLVSESRICREGWYQLLGISNCCPADKNHVRDADQVQTTCINFSLMRIPCIFEDGSFNWATTLSLFLSSFPCSKIFRPARIPRLNFFSWCKT